MKRTIVEHIASLLFVIAAFLALLFFLRSREAEANTARTQQIAPYVNLKFLDFGNPMHAAMFREALDLYYPGRGPANDSLMQAIDAYRVERFTNAAYKSGGEPPGLTWSKLGRLGWMYLQFIVVYAIVMVLTYYGAQSLAVFRFIKMKQRSGSYIASFRDLWGRRRKASPGAIPVSAMVLLALKAVAKGIAYAVLFSPAYVIAYSFKTRFDTDSILFMIILGVISNGLLITFANKFYTFLTTESRRGYVDTAVVKNLRASYAWGRGNGLPYQAVFRPEHMFPGHVFRHIFLNARYQYIPALKEHASFLITGLIIIEMALNIQGHLGYELLQNILYKRYEVVITILLGIFLIVKATEIFVDIWAYREARRYGNT